MTTTEREKLAKFWREQSQDDLKAAQHLIVVSRLYPQGLFFLHLAIEKILKSIFVQKTGAHPPFTHNLLTLLDRIELKISLASLKNLAIINEFNLSTRYPDEKAKLKQKFTAAYSKKYLKIGTSIYQWLSEQKP
jgi:HEPN domain-containing protein